MLSSEATDGRNKVWRAQTDKSVEENVIATDVVGCFQKNYCPSVSQSVTHTFAGCSLNYESEIELCYLNDYLYVQLDIGKFAT